MADSHRKIERSSTDVTLTRAFKSGNSTAVRLPKSFGITPGTPLKLREEQGQLIVEPVRSTTDKFDVWAFYGSIPDAELIADRSIDPRPSERGTGASG